MTYPEPDVTNCGGVTPFMKIAHLAEAFNGLGQFRRQIAVMAL